MKKTICLSMIVKDESPVIRRCLKSVKPLLDHWVIVDTGSTDGTQEIICDEMKGTPGTLYERPWKNFSHNRTEALRLAKGKGDYALLIDADEQLILKEGFEMPQLSADLYLIDVNMNLLAAYREILVNNQIDWYWEGVLHEQITSAPPPTKVESLKNAYNFSSLEGNRSRNPGKFEKDLEILLEGLKEEPDNSRYVFYIAQTYAALGLWQNAIDFYERRVEMDGWHQEVYLSLYRIGFMKEMQNLSSAEIVQSYQKAYRFLPCRAEPLFRIAYQFYCCCVFQEAKRLALEALKIPVPPPQFAFYIEPQIYRGWLKKLYADCCFELGEDAEALRTYESLVGNTGFSEEGKMQIQDSIYHLKKRVTPGLKRVLPRFLKF